MFFTSSRRARPSVHGVIVLALAASSALSLSMVGAVRPAFAQSLASYDIPAGPLATSLNQFARQAGVELVYDAVLTQGVAGQTLRGRFGAAEGLSHLLAGTGLTFQQTAPRVFTI